MKQILILFFLLISFYKASSQKIPVEGIAFDTKQNRSWVTITLNDTIHKFLKDTARYNTQKYSQLFDDTSFLVFAKEDGHFKIMAEPTDSLFFDSYHHIRKSFLVADLLKLKTINILLEQQPCETYVSCEDEHSKQYVFIGEKIDVSYMPETYYCDRVTMDSKFKARYKIIENVYGNYQGDTISFIAYDHYGKPAFSKYQYVLLFVGEYCNKLVHHKYQYCNVYKTADNRWAAPYQTSDYIRLDSSSTIKPEIIKFNVPVETDISGASAEYVSQWFPSPYYKIENGKAIAVYGNYINELFELKKQTVFKARKVEFTK